MRLGILAAALLAGALGCAPALPPTAKVAGTVTLDGKVLSEGSIRFHPADKDAAAATSVPIVDGKYSAPTLPKGSYRVSFSAGAGTASAAPPADGVVDSTFNAPSDPKPGAEKKNPIPEKYRKPSLPADVTADNPALNFELKSN